MAKTLPCELIDWPRITELSGLLAQKIRDARVDIDMIIAIGRGGYIPARLLSDLLGIFNLASFKIEHYKGAHKANAARIQYPLNAPVESRKILLVDDVSDSGDTFNVAVDHIRSLGNPKQLHTAVLHHKVLSRFVPDFFALKVEQWRWIIYPWAVTEDLASFITDIEPAAQSIDQITAYLWQSHGIRVSAQQARDALRLLGIDSC